MADFPYLPIWVADFMGDTQHLDCLETGAYLLLLFAAWRSPECGLPDEDRKLARLARCSLKQWLRIRPVIMAFWKLGGDGLWHQKKLDEVRQTASGKSLKAVQAAQAMWLKRRETEAADAQRTHSGRIANQSHNQTRSESDQKISTDPARDASLTPRGYATRASKPPTTSERVAVLAAKKRAAFQ